MITYTYFKPILKSLVAPVIWLAQIGAIYSVIICMKKLLDSDWLRAVQFKCNAGAKSVTPVQITHRNSGLWLTERQKEIF